MKVELTNTQVMNAIQSINELMVEKLPFKVSWNLTKNFKKLYSIMETINELEKKLVEQYAIKEENGNIKIFPDKQFKIKPEFINVFNKERSELFECVNDPDIDMIKSSALAEFDIKGAILFNIAFMIQDENDEQMKE